MQYQCEWPLTPEPPLLCVMYICNAFCLWRQARDGYCVWQYTNWKIFPEMTQNHWRNDELLWFQSYPVCTRSSERFGNCRCSLRFFIANDMSVCDCSFKFQLLFSRCDAFGQANGKSSLGFLMLFRWLSLFLFSCFFVFFFSVFLYYRCNLVVFIFVCWDEGRCQPRFIKCSLSLIIFYTFPLVVCLFCFIPKL